MQDRFLCESKLTYTEALEMALAAETAVKDSQKLCASGDDDGAPPVVLSDREETTVHQITRDREQRGHVLLLREGHRHNQRETLLLTENLSVTDVLVNMTPQGVASKIRMPLLQKKRPAVCCKKKQIENSQNTEQAH